MTRIVYSFAGVILLSSHPYSCHKPTAEESYAHDKRCFAALDANLKIVPAARFKQVGVDPGAVDLVSKENVSGAFDWGERLGMSPGAIYKDLERAARRLREVSHLAASWSRPAEIRSLGL